jgi:hypothetical protein
LPLVQSMWSGWSTDTKISSRLMVGEVAGAEVAVGSATGAGVSAAAGAGAVVACATGVGVSGAAGAEVGTGEAAPPQATARKRVIPRVVKSILGLAGIRPTIEVFLLAGSIDSFSCPMSEILDIYIISLCCSFVMKLVNFVSGRSPGVPNPGQHDAQRKLHSRALCRQLATATASAVINLIALHKCIRPARLAERRKLQHFSDYDPPSPFIKREWGIFFTLN